MIFSMIKDLWERAKITGEPQRFSLEEKKEFVAEFARYSSKAMEEIREDRLKSENDLIRH